MVVVQLLRCVRLFCNSMDDSPPGSFVPEIFAGKDTGSCHFFLQGIFLTQGLNPGLLHWQTDSSPLNHQGSPLEGRMGSNLPFPCVLMGFVEADDLWPWTPSTTSGSSAAKALYLMPSCQFPAETQKVL